MNYTLSGILAVSLIVVMVIKSKFRIYKLITMPLFVILLTYCNFFLKYEKVHLLPSFDFILLLSLLLFLLSYSIAKRCSFKSAKVFFTKTINRENADGVLLVEKIEFLYCYLALTILYCVFDLWMNTMLYGSLESALIRFYGKPMVGDFPSILKNSLGFLYKALISFIFVFRFFQNKYQSKSGCTFLYIIVLLLMIIAIPRGSRGAVVAPLFLLVIADLFSMAYIKTFSIFRRIRDYLLLVFFGFFAVIFLTLSRNVNFEEIGDVYEVVSELKIKDASEKYSEGEGELILRDAQLCYTEFGHRVPFLSFTYSLKTILFAPIPRFLYPEKRVSFGFVLNEVKQGGTKFNPDNLVYHGAVCWAAGIAGEGWANGGIAGVIFYSLLLGFFSGFCANLYYYLINSNNYLSVIFALLLYQASAIVRGDYLSTLSQSVYPIIILILVIAIFYKKKKIA